MNSIKDVDVDNKKVLVRVDFNVPLNKLDGSIADDFRIRAHLETIKYLIENKAKVILISHLSKPRGREAGLTLKPVAQRLGELLNISVKFVEEVIGERVEREIEILEPGEVLLLENIRFYPEEEENNGQFAATIARLANIFVEDAFSVCHREHASIVGIPKFIPSYSGLLLEKEINNLKKITESPKTPFIAIIGGAKVETKVGVIEHLLEKADAVLLGGKAANEVLKLKEIYGEQTVKDKVVFEATKGLDIDNPKLIVPIDGIIEKDGYSRIDEVNNIKEGENVLDIGPETIEIYKRIIGKGKTIIWNGPMGKIEEEVFMKGTREICEAIANSDAFSVAGGGETIDFINKFKMQDKFKFLSSGGGAMLEFISGKELPGISALEKSYDR